MSTKNRPILQIFGTWKCALMWSCLIITCCLLIFMRTHCKQTINSDWKIMKMNHFLQNSVTYLLFLNAYNCPLEVVKTKNWKGRIGHLYAHMSCISLGILADHGTSPQQLIYFSLDGCPRPMKEKQNFIYKIQTQSKNTG